MPVVAIASILLWITMVIGWIINIIKIIGIATTDPTPTTMFILRIVGIFLPPLGGVVGWF